jgi:dihydroxyacetone kinase
VLGDEDSVSPERAREAVLRTRQAVSDFGKAQVGDKTLVDALVPFVETFAERIDAGAAPFDAAWRDAAGAARTAAEQTADLMPRLGRARSHGEKSLGTPDPGAISLALIVETVLGSVDRNS